MNLKNIILIILTFIVNLNAFSAENRQHVKKLDNYNSDQFQTKLEKARLANQMFSRRSSEDGGVIGSGGGNIGSSQMMNFILNKLGGTPSASNIFRIKHRLIEVLRTIATYPPKDIEKNALLNQLNKMLQAGLIRNIESTIYRPSSHCEVDGVVKSASTGKINLYQNPNLTLPEICLNIPKLTYESPTEGELLGLLLHEHSRHYGYEDTDEIGVHPFAYEMQVWFDYLKKGFNPLNYNFGTPSFIGTNIIKFSEKTNSVIIYENRKKLFILLDPNLIRNHSNSKVFVKSFSKTIEFSILEPIRVSFDEFNKDEAIWLQFSEENTEIQEAKKKARLFFSSNESIQIDLTKWSHFENIKIEY